MNNEIMSNIKEYLTLMYNETDPSDHITRNAIRHLSRSEIVTRCKCPNCGFKFEPHEGFKSGLIVFE